MSYHLASSNFDQIPARITANEPTDYANHPAASPLARVPYEGYDQSVKAVEQRLAGSKAFGSHLGPNLSEPLSDY